MKKTGICPKCDSSNIIADAKVIDRGESHAQYQLTVATFRNPDAWIRKGQQSTKVSAWVCADCGFLEFYAKHPQDLVLP